MPDILSEDITFLQGVGPKRAALLNKLGVYTVADLLHLYPRGYIDLSHRTYFRQVADDSVKHAFDVVALTDPVKSMIRKNLTLYKFKVSDGHGDATVILYNEKYTAMKIHRGERYLLYGKVLDKNGLTLPSPQIMDIDIQ